MRKRKSCLSFCVFVLFFFSCFFFPSCGYAEEPAVVVDGYALYDPWEAHNRRAFRSGMDTDRVFVRPLAVGYAQKAPPVFPFLVHNFIENIRDWGTAINEVLQGKITQAASDFVRVLLNSTLGFGGLGDPAGALGWAKNYQDFDVTLAHWGVPPGPYLFVPFLGTVTVRDLSASLLETLWNPFFVFSGEGLTVLVLQGIDARASLLNLDDFLFNPILDQYVLARSIYWQKRIYLLKGNSFSGSMLSQVRLDQMGSDPLGS